MVKTFKVFAALLDYPQAELIAAVPDLRQVLDDERLLGRKHRASLDRLLQELDEGDLMALQERYVDLFDRARSLSLHLFEHVHGESRDRGQALVDLGARYAREGYVLASSELPDFLPAMLEFLSQRPREEAREMLTDAAHILQAIGARLDKRASPYAAVFHALVALSGSAVDAVAIEDAELEREKDPAEIDRLWAETPAFGPASGCGAGSQQSGSEAVVRFYKGTAR